MASASNRSKLDEYSVYARPYVPLKWRQFNEKASSPVSSPPPPWINFGQYTQSFAGNAFLQAKDIEIEPSHEQHGDQFVQLDQHNYSRFFAKALSQETAALQEEYDDYALYSIALPHDNNSVYYLSVPGLREAGLRIEVGDVVHVRQLRFDKFGEPVITPTFRDHNGKAIETPNSVDKRYDAAVWAIDRLREVILLRIDAMPRRSMVFNGSFTIQARRMNEVRLAVQRTQARLDEADNLWIKSMLFPEIKHGHLQHELNIATFQVKFYDHMLNYEQQRAVQTILDNAYGKLPYLISGPPGTGKTKTVTETALQLVAKNTTNRVVLCAPSDPAADTLGRRLSQHLSPQMLLRVNSPSRSFPEVPEAVLPFCCVENDIFSLPPFSELMRKKVVVLTCRDVDVLRKARLSNEDLFQLERNVHTALHPEHPPIFPQLHWSSLIIDEAAQATEPEALLPLLLVAPPKEAQYEGNRLPTVVMVGDQKQLGPRTACKIGPIRVSLFERLLARSLYCGHPLARSRQFGGLVRPLTSDMLPIVRPPFTDLIRNYRSHPAILATPSSLFYNDTLEPAAENTDSLLSWPGFGEAQLPVLFADNRRLDEIERDGGGWYNLGEADLAIYHAESFVRQGLLHPHEICIMSPFSAQVRVLRMKARDPAVGMPGINIGPLEAFQGLESRLVIICTTRTRDRFIDQDLARGLGVIHEPRRFNVALTRAKEGLIVIGNPHVLGQDENWESFIAFCLRTDANTGWTGRHIDDWQPRPGTKIETSRLEKQMSYKARLDQSQDFNVVARRLGHLKFGMSEEQAMWESGIQAEAVMRKDQDLEGEFYSNSEK
ncbi:hypothetical protein M409DRAFT_25831 [Zasmidium cellare ATCC 36951]|uniref:Uncharacterized protein n=1 Tax=Zasmidium cellare ATCC 36951 TaxID=1080233 RepID=A0A6A6C9Z9_ZASCE|nr:uncharacterized protein M409DRAFT_25831 [Zasmidium cellare ATCC 36951]KAF2163643.1 hypothetical protein M409DRAFT_25831 [Zasmidium cellare ATCC 36951]